MRRAQTALEYLFMLAAALILVAIALRTVLDTTKQLQQTVSSYAKAVRKNVLEDL
ncbi:class III signal peptide-containing protein [Thermococcus gammatolerans]|uniref:class III signal peptide-containing protein n=1 Tax=Thermococcus gammatolerans TaxID=187878 RepID=UPI000B28EC47|nr:class III signal peptide-containing protein [Thermococcus gammatolerans]